MCSSCNYVYTISDGQKTWQWMEAVSDAPLSDHVETYSAPILDPRELHIEQIFRPNRFDILSILKALNVSISVVSFLSKTLFFNAITAEISTSSIMLLGCMHCL